jgi:hypothetical protein
MRKLRQRNRLVLDAPRATSLAHIQSSNRGSQGAWQWNPTALTTLFARCSARPHDAPSLVSPSAYSSCRLCAMVTLRPTKRGKIPIDTRRRGRTGERRNIPIAAQRTPHYAKTPMNQRRGSYRDVATRRPTARATLTRSVRTAAAVSTTSRHAAAVLFMASAVPVVPSAPNPLIFRTWRAAALTTRCALAAAAMQKKNAA